MLVERINITIPAALREALDREAEREQLKRSTLIQHAVALYLRVAEKKQLQALLREGYVEMAAEATGVTKVFEHLDRESLRHVDSAG